MEAEERRFRIQNEIDSRMHSLMLAYLDEDFKDDELSLAYMRAAYAAGYSDCYQEPASQRGKWVRKLGYKIKEPD